jgi:apolipoprotein N-acyltransferase
MPETPLVSSPSRRLLALWLALGAALLMFAMGRNTFAPAAWLAPVFLLRYTRQVRKRSALVFAWLVMFGAFLFQFRGMIQMPLPGILATAAGTALCGMLPFIFDRWATRGFTSFASSLIFPCALTAVDFSTNLSPYGSWGVLGYSQYGNLPVMQLAAATGIYGISFLVAWLGSSVNWAWEHGFKWDRIRLGATVFIAALATVYLGGSARLLASKPSGGTQRVAAIAADSPWKFPNQTDRLFARSESAAQAGARLVFWSEGATSVLKADEPSLLARAAEIARRNQIYLGLAYGCSDPRTSKLHQNKLVLIGPDGSKLFEYWKSRPVPGPEKESTETNGNPMRYADTPFGRIGGFICFDLDFPSLIRQAGLAHTDLMIAPSNDWAAIDPWNTEMAAFRAVENGCTLVRDVSHGRSLAVDYLGRTLGETDYFQDSRHILLSDVPTQGVRTLYARCGDFFGWLCVLSLVLIVAVRWQRGPNGSGSV